MPACNIALVNRTPPPNNNNKTVHEIRDKTQRKQQQKVHQVDCQLADRSVLCAQPPIRGKKQVRIKQTIATCVASVAYPQKQKRNENASALDLRATPLSLHIPQMTTEVQQQQQNRSVFKMNDFWNQARGPPQNMAQNLTSTSAQNSPQQLQNRSASTSAINERTLEECWSTLQRVSWHIFQCVARFHQVICTLHQVPLVAPNSAKTPPKPSNS
ncbi:hypothetical protein CBL_12908 [Carabus blaptoides fortunei]